MFNIKRLKRASALLAVMAIVFFSVGVPVFASPEQESSAVAEQSDIAAEGGLKGSKALASAIAIGLPAAGGAIAMGIAIAKSVDGISRQPEAEGKIRTSLMLGLVFIETAIIYALIVAILVIFVL